MTQAIALGCPVDNKFIPMLFQKLHVFHMFIV